LGGVRFVAIAQVGPVAIGDEEQITEHFHFVTLLAIAEQRRDGYAKMLAEQIEQRRLQRGKGMHGDTQVEGLQAAACRVAVGERLPGAVEHAVVVADGAPEQDRKSTRLNSS